MLLGRILSDTFPRSVPRKHWDAFADQFASIYYQLSSLRFESVGRVGEVPGKETKIEIVPQDDMGPFSTSLKYFYAHRKSQTRYIEADHPDDEQWGKPRGSLNRLFHSWLSRIIFADLSHCAMLTCTTTYLLMKISKSREYSTGLMHKQFI